MILTPQQIDVYKRNATNAGLSPEEINQGIVNKETELSGSNPIDIKNLNSHLNQVSSVENRNNPLADIQNNSDVVVGDADRETKGFVGNAARDAGDIARGVLSLPGVAIDTVLHPNTIPDKGAAIASGLVDEYGSLLSNPVKHFQEKPVSTVLDVLPFVKPLQALSGLGKAGEAGKVLEVAGEAGNAAKVANGASKAGMLENAGSVVKKANKLRTQALPDLIKGGAVKSEELIGGGGTKEYIARSVMQDNPIDLSEAALKHNVAGAMTTKGKIINTQKGIVEEGQAIEKALKGSNYSLSNTEFSKMIGSKLRQLFPNSDESAIKVVERQLNREGQFNIKSGDQIVSALKQNELKTRLMDLGEKWFNSADKKGVSGATLRDVSESAAKVIRDNLAIKVPGATQPLRFYAALRTMMNEFKNPTGFDTSGGVFKSIAGAGRNIAGKATQTIYNAADKGIVFPSKTYKVAQAGRFLPDISSGSSPVNVDPLSETVSSSEEQSMPDIYPYSAYLSDIHNDPNNSDKYAEYYKNSHLNSNGMGNTSKIVSQLESMYSSLEGTGPVSGRLSELSTYIGGSNNVAAYNDFKNGVVAPIIRSLGEKGSLSDKDTARAVNLLPSVSDTQERAKLKLSALKTLLNSITSGN